MNDKEKDFLGQITTLKFKIDKQEEYIKSLEEMNKSQSINIFKLNEKLLEAKEWFIDIAEYKENRSDFEKYLREVWKYEKFS